jgi:hypothetical protein
MPTILPGAASSQLYDRFRSRARRDPNAAELAEFKGAFNWNWDAPIDEGQFNTALSAIDTRFAAPTAPVVPGAPPAGAFTQPTTPEKSPWSWDNIEAAPEFTGPDKFVYEDFQAPGAEGMYADRGYQFRLKQGIDALEASKANNGRFLSGETLRDIMSYGQGLASQEYDKTFGRATTTYGINRGNAADMWDRSMMLEQARHAPKQATWEARTGAGINRDNMEFDRDWQQDIYWNDDQFRRESARSDDEWRRYVYQNDDAFRKAVFGSDDEVRRAVQKENEAWKREMMIEDRLRFLTQMGR